MSVCITSYKTEKANLLTEGEEGSVFLLHFPIEVH